MSISVCNICKSFNGRSILTDLTFKVAGGEFLSITGKSGSGKSTLLNMLGLIDDADSGYIVFNETKINKHKTIQASKIRRYEISYLFQNYALMDNESVYNNLAVSTAYTPKMSKAEKTKYYSNALDALGLSSSYLKKRVFELSGGEQQRVAFARAIMKPHSIIVADEPTGSLDCVNKKVIIEQLKKECELGIAVIVATHEKSIAEISDTIITL